MRLVSFAVDGFRGVKGGLEKNKIDFTNSSLIFLFGQNNVGKSSFLTAYDYFYYAKAALKSDYHRKQTDNPITFDLVVQMESADLALVRDKYPNKIKTFLSYLDKENNIELRLQHKNSEKIAFTKNPTSGEWDDKYYGSLGLDSIFTELLPTPMYIEAMPTEETVASIVNKIMKDKWEANLDEDAKNALDKVKSGIAELQEKMYSQDDIKNYTDKVNEQFNKLFPDFSIQLKSDDRIAYTENKLGSKFEVEFEKHNEGVPDKDVPTELTHIGHGAIRTAIFTLLLMKDAASKGAGLSKKYLILFEEPELFLHPSLMRILKDLVYSIIEGELPYQMLCASHSPQMIDLSKRKSSIVRMVKENSETSVLQIDDMHLADLSDSKSPNELKQKMYEVLRFNPYICESFYADEVLLVEGPTEEILVRGILQKENSRKEVFIVNCGSITNIPFYQRVYSQFMIKHHIICDTDNEVSAGKDINDTPIFTAGIQKTISDQARLDNLDAVSGLLLAHHTTFEVAHKSKDIPDYLRFPDSYPSSAGKPFNANRYWKEILDPNYEKPDINLVPIVCYTRDILSYKWIDNHISASRQSLISLLNKRRDKI